MKRLINLQPPRISAIMLALLPFLLVFFVYVSYSNERLAANPNDKLLPAISSIGVAIERMALEPSKRSGELLWWVDTASSLRRLGMGVAISAIVGLVIGIGLGALPLLSAGLSPFVASVSLIPPMAVLPILFICFGLGELSKVVLIVFGIAPVIARDIQGRVREIPRELIVKAQTLGASTWLVILRVVLPLALPRLIDAVRLSLGAAWLFLIAAEAIANSATVATTLWVKNVLVAIAAAPMKNGTMMCQRRSRCLSELAPISSMPKRAATLGRAVRMPMWKVSVIPALRMNVGIQNPMA